MADNACVGRFRCEGQYQCERHSGRNAEPRYDEAVVDGVWMSATHCRECRKPFPPYGVGVPTEHADEYCWGAIGHLRQWCDDNRYHASRFYCQAVNDVRKLIGYPDPIRAED